MVLGQHALDLGLLEHDLGDEHGVGVARVAPGQRGAAVGGVPCEQTGVDPGAGVRGRLRVIAGGRR
jgi:hypothetical protein